MDAAPKKSFRDEHLARWEMVAAGQAREISNITEADALRIIRDLGDVENPWHPAPYTSGLVEQQTIFHRRRHFGGRSVPWSDGGR